MQSVSGNPGGAPGTTTRHERCCYCGEHRDVTVVDNGEPKREHGPFKPAWWAWGGHG
jgi:hypothetical protein